MALFHHDPGPCPVDDCPHTTCTSPDYDPTGTRVVVQRPLRARDQGRAPRVFGDPTPTKTSFTTATYQRAVHRQVRR
jgi:hypothetical protein